MYPQTLVFTILSIYFAIYHSNSQCFVHAISHNQIIASCNQTPYPETCNHFIGTKASLESNKIDVIDQTLFRYQSLFVTMNQAIEAHKMISSINMESFGRRAKSAWSDCLELYNDSIHHLNRSIRSKSRIDSQTWLSASLTNQQTCRNGFEDFNLSSHLDFIATSDLLSNFSKLLSNSLAVNKDLNLGCRYRRLFNDVSDDDKKLLEVDFTSPTTNKELNMGDRFKRLFNDELEFPYWISNNDRKLLKIDSRIESKVDIIVAKDGSGHFKNINEAVAIADKRSDGKRFIIYVKRGVYNENVKIKKSLKNLMFIGDGIDATIITSNRNVQDGFTTFRSATFGVSGPGFIAKDMTFENTAGPSNHQAVALRSSSDFSVFYRCSFKGYQDTLYVHSHRQFYRDCDIHGTVDFIFGDAAVVLQNCNVFIRNPLANQRNTVTAQGRSDPNENTGIIIHNSRVTAGSDLIPGSVRSYLGRPWRAYSRTVFMKCELDGVIDSAGWLPWNGDFGLSTLYYGEYMNTGAGSSTFGRVKWPGYRVIRSPVEAGKFTVGNFLAGETWIPGTGVPFESGI